MQPVGISHVAVAIYVAFSVAITLTSAHSGGHGHSWGHGPSSSCPSRHSWSSGSGPPWWNPSQNQGVKEVVFNELEYLNTIPVRKTGSPDHNTFIDHLQEDLESLGLDVQSDTWHFKYNESPLTPPTLSISGNPIHVSSIVPYSGNTGPEGVTGKLISLIGPNLVPDWKMASGGIAVVNLTNADANRTLTVPLWPGSEPWDPSYVQLPSGVANALVHNLTDARDAGVKGIVYVWEELSTGLAEGQYGPFWTNFQGIPALYASPETTEAVIAAAQNNEEATLVLTGTLTHHTPTRSIWVTIPGTENPHESVLLSTHTDGVNIGEENGHIALLSYARSLVEFPPKRTTVIGFITAHIHSAPFSYATHRSTTLFLAQHPELWNGSQPDGVGFKAVFGSCVEHLGMKTFDQNLKANTYTLTNHPAAEVLFAATQELADLTFDEWCGASPKITRVINPLAPVELTTGVPNQGGEGLPYLLLKIPEISLVTAPAWLLKEFPEGTDERPFIDYDAVQRQVESFERIWRKVDETPADQLGTVSF